AYLRRAKQLIYRVELLRLREMADVASVEEKIGRFRQRVDLGDSRLQRADNVLVRLLAESDMAVADLDEAEIALCHPGHRGVRRLAEAGRGQHAAAERAEQSCPRPGHTFEKSAPVYAVRVAMGIVIFRHGVVPSPLVPSDLPPL